MARRTAQLVAMAIKMLPPLADAGILLGEDRYPAEAVFSDLLEHSRVIGPVAEAGMAVGRWEHAWREAPLVIHDAGLAGAVDAVAGAVDADLVGMRHEISTAAIGLVLEQHPGPVASIRVESTGTVFEPEVVEGWMEHLEAKEEGRRGLGELIVINTAGADHDISMTFPLHRLPGGLRSLTLGFFALRLHDARHLANLTEMRITSCAFNGNHLSGAVQSLHSLTTLVIGGCCLTSGCGSEGLSITSTSLLRLHFWSCTASGGILLHYTPRVAFLCTGVLPTDGNRLNIDLRTPIAMRFLHGLMMHYHDLTFISTTVGKLNGRNIAPLPNLSSLRVCLHMSTKRETIRVLDLLRHLPYLRQLRIMRVDDAHGTEEVTTEDPFKVPCITDALQEVGIESFKGGIAELVFAIHILTAASSLLSFLIEPCSRMNPTQVTEAVNPLFACPRASPSCQITII